MRAETHALEAQRRLDEARGIARAEGDRIACLEVDLEFARKANALHKIGRAWQRGVMTKKAEQEALQARYLSINYYG